MREAQFAFRSCDLKSWNSSSRQTEEVDETNSDPVWIQELVDKAKELKCLGETYHAGIIIGLKNNCQTFVKEFLQKVHPHLLNKFFRTVPYTILT